MDRNSLFAEKCKLFPLVGQPERLDFTIAPIFKYFSALPSIGLKILQASTKIILHRIISVV